MLSIERSSTVNTVVRNSTVPENGKVETMFVREITASSLSKLSESDKELPDLVLDSKLSYLYPARQFTTIEIGIFQCMRT